MVPLLGAALSGGLSLLSGFGAQSSAKSQQRRQLAYDEYARNWNQGQINNLNNARQSYGEKLLSQPDVATSENSSWVDVEGMMSAANRAGFNPVTWIQNGGLQAYTQSSSRNTSTNYAAAYEMMLPQLNLINASTAVNVPSALSVIGDAGQAALKSFQTDARLQESQAFQERLLGLKLDSIQKGKSRVPGFAGMLSTGTSGGYTTRGGMASVNNALTDRTPQEVTPTLNGYSEPAPNPTIQYFDAGDGRFMIGQSTKYKESSEDDVLATLSWNVANRFLPMLGVNQKPPSAMLYGDERWVYNPVYQTYERTTEQRFDSSKPLYTVTPVPKETPNGLSINGYKIWPFW